MVLCIFRRRLSPACTSSHECSLSCNGRFGILTPWRSKTVWHTQWTFGFGRFPRTRYLGEVVATEPPCADSPLTNATQLRGSVALIRRKPGHVASGATLAAQAGAVAVLMVDDSVAELVANYSGMQGLYQHQGRYHEATSGWFHDPVLGAGMCGVQSVTNCSEMCAAVSGCRFCNFKTSTEVSTKPLSFLLYLCLYACLRIRKSL